MADLFGSPAPAQSAHRPLADRLRPQRLADVVGQEHLTGETGALTRMIALGRAWQPRSSGDRPAPARPRSPACWPNETDLAFEQISAIFSGVADLKKVFEGARIRRQGGRATLLFVDEIHRFNRAQQDSFLPVMEDGTIVLVGATTENPSFELNAALLSRANVLTFKPLGAGGAVPNCWSERRHRRASRCRLTRRRVPR